LSAIAPAISLAGTLNRRGGGVRENADFANGQNMIGGFKRPREK
jgi:hypothetical protein